MINQTPLFRALSTAIAIGTLGVAAALGAAPSASAALNPDSLAPVTTAASCGNGVSAISITPAAGFNPLTATAAQLSANGYPDRPSSANADEVSHWKSYVGAHREMKTSCADQRRAPDGVVHGPDRLAAGSESLVGGSESHNWDGYVVPGTAYTDAEAGWSLPRAGPIANMDMYSSSWVGLGSGNAQNQPLIQAGSESDDIDGTSEDYLWYEVYPEGGAAHELTAAVAAGTAVGVHVGEIHGQTTGCTWPYCGGIHIWDTSDNVNEMYTVGGNWSNNGQAEFIYERPCVTSLGSNCYPYLADAAPEFTGAEAVPAGGSWEALGSLPQDNIEMVSCAGHEMANASSVYPSETFFTDWTSWGDSGVC
jgi:hypothetical protein